MTEFLREIRSRLDAARQSLEEARRDDDDYLVQVRLGEVDSLERLESEHRAESVGPRDPGDPVIDLRDDFRSTV